MVFSSLPFLFIFLPAVLLINYIIPERFRNIFLLFANLVFYAYGEPLYVVIMLASMVVNFLFARVIEKSNRKKVLLIFAIALNIGSLFIFKYTSFIFTSLNSVLPFNFPDVNIPLPIGISFYTFQAVSYVIDVYRGSCRAEHSFINFSTYISLFPQLIAGPIVRYRDVDSQLVNRKSDFSEGVTSFVSGLAKKVLLANQFGLLWDSISSAPFEAGVLGAWLGAIAFTFQIYFDFSGYSDMAIGLGRMLGFEFMINFNYPYIAESITDFWRRWHISLSSWFRDYVYIPLGGNRVKKLRFCFNILLVWMLTGLWHGAGWNLILWGLYYGLLLLFEKLFIGKFLAKLPRILRHIYTLFIVIIGWVLFASESFSALKEYITAMFCGKLFGNVNVLPYLIMLIIASFASTPIAKRLYLSVCNKKYAPVFTAVLCFMGLLLCTASLVSSSYNPFLYFRF